MYQVIKPIQCSKCGGRNIAKPINQNDNSFVDTYEIIDLICLDCGHKKSHVVTTATTDTFHNYQAVSLPEQKDYEEF